jgi:antitoxin component of MazEF toxin-antitoxin module
MIQTVGIWGNNLAVRIPRDVSFLKKGQPVEVIVNDNTIQIVPVKRRRSMAELLDGHKGVFKGELVDFGPDAGEEAVL